MSIESQNAVQNIQLPEIIKVDKGISEVRCNGGDGVLGHPVTWYKREENHSVKCGYCGFLFVKE